MCLEISDLVLSVPELAKISALKITKIRMIYSLLPEKMKIRKTEELVDIFQPRFCQAT